ncbi:uncharacterized protein F4822DRAFT_440774 [Hypoxylon trugodes]|uniref:uncharacterized protein n=1 Tax=Hypoxylon trugodes TaxID=326681 RepID=UPI0021993484|nr:uncharacterized protein F4822DRAFT_440774 [Hypoxylon trugodes]KAI1383093.1 hypothetical protein F4822DRAFT_440774 [Hypoxylon trugodes]
MRLQNFLALAASLGLASSNEVLDERAAKCGIKGNRILPAYWDTTQASFTVPAQCGALCTSQLLCQSYAVEDGHCRLYLLPVNTLLAHILSGNNTFYDRGCATSTNICQVNGFRSLLNQAFTSSNKIADNSFNGCSALCKKTSGCTSFSIELATGGKCRLYKNALVKDFTPDPYNLNIYWDINCPRDVASPGPVLDTSTPATTIPSITTEAIVTFAPAETPTALVTNDPPYTPTGPQVTPDDDDEFISTYTYEEFQLPTVVAEGAPPITTGIGQPTDIPTAPCLVQTGSAAQFSVLNENFIPMVSRTSSSIGPLQQPTKAPAAGDPLLDPETLVLPAFYLQPISGVSNVYDLVYAGSSTPQYVAMTNTGNVVLVSASTGTSFKNNRVTTIFSVDCYGRISVSQGGSKYTWSTDGSTSRFVKATTPANNMKALPVNIPEVQSALKHRRRNKELAARLMKRSYSDGPAPKCPASPPALVAGTKAGYKYGEGNFCDNLSDYWSLSPFDFDGSCAVQSLCYDQCKDFGWQSCNGIFGTMMILSCLDAFDSWWEVIPAVACAAQAGYFTGVAATKTGRDLFYKAQGSMCRCFCSSPPDTCVYSSGDFYCADIHGSDDSNCGNCGRQCGPNSKCRSGKCGCPRDQCGSTCLDFRNNPNNCGSCGNVCNPSYCLDGRCYVPQPGDCVPEQSVTNNDFTTWYPSIVNWTMAAYPTCTIGDNIEFSGTHYIANGGSDPAVLVEMTNLPNDGCHAAMVQSQVKMCPGIQYEFTFAMGYVNKVGDSMVTSNADCTVRWLTGTPTTWTGSDNFQSSDTYQIGVNHANYKTFGPWTLHVSEGETGVTKVKKSLYVNLTAVIHCGNANGGAGRFIIRDIQMNPVGSLKARSPTIGDVKEDPILQRRDSATNITAELEPYYPDQKKGEVLLTSFTTNATKRDEESIF